MTKQANAGGKPKLVFQVTDKPRYSIDEAAALLGVSRIHLYNRINRGELKIVRDGARVFIAHKELYRYAGTDQESRTP